MGFFGGGGGRVRVPSHTLTCGVMGLGWNYSAPLGALSKGAKSPRGNQVTEPQCGFSIGWNLDTTPQAPTFSGTAAPALVGLVLTVHEARAAQEVIAAAQRARAPPDLRIRTCLWAFGSFQTGCWWCPRGVRVPGITCSLLICTVRVNTSCSHSTCSAAVAPPPLRSSLPSLGLSIPGSSGSECLWPLFT